MSGNKLKIIREPAEIRFKEELDALRSADTDPKPEGWILSPRSVVKFITGSDEPITVKSKDGKKEVYITRKFYGDDIMIERAVASLASDRPLLLIGEPGTAKSWLSENLAAAICNNSLNIIQGTAGTTEDQIKYSWNYALLVAKGPSTESLVPAPFYTCMKKGEILRFEEITRCSHEIQDTIISILSDKVMVIPELPPPDDILFAARGFGVIATANTRDKGVNEMSSALKRRFNFETVVPIKNLNDEIELVTRETEAFLERSAIKMTPDRDVIELIVTTFHELRNGTAEDGTKITRPSAVMSTAEAVEVSVNTAVYSYYMKDGEMTPEAAVINLIGTVVKDNYDDINILRNYFNVIAKRKADTLGGKRRELWKKYFKARKYI